jgi:hypothetical protein
MITNPRFYKLFLLAYVMLFCLFTVSGQDKLATAEILSHEYEFKIISSGDNFPNFNPGKNNLSDIIILLHHEKTPDEIQKYFKWDKNTLNSKLDLLKNANFITYGKDRNIYPNVFVCALKDGLRITRELGPVIIQTADSIQWLSKILEKKVMSLTAFKKAEFDQVSFLLLSDILLDNWQINNVENEFLNTSRTLRHGKNYYASFMEKPKGTSLEAFGIYGNQIENESNFALCRYGNQRYSEEILTLNLKLKKEFTSLKEIKGISCFIIDTSDNKQLQIIANTFKSTLLKILNQQKTLFQKNYLESIYSKEISFEEYFIWIYHFYYTAVTDELIHRNVIKMPGEKVAFYILKYE